MVGDVKGPLTPRSRGELVPTAAGIPIRWSSALAQQLYLNIRSKTAPQYRLLISPDHPAHLRLLGSMHGVYNHSLSVGNAAGKTAYQIGANADLARVAGYFHDFGKLQQGTFYAGATSGLRTIRSIIDSEAELQLLIGHPQAAREFLVVYPDIPEAVIEIAAQHHGTTRTFANVTAELLAAHGGIIRYPGPKPQSKEAAIVMLADEIDAYLSLVSHRKQLPRPLQRQHIHAAVDHIFDELLADEQFAESGLTSGELARIKNYIMWPFYRFYKDYDLVSTPAGLRKHGR